MSLPCASEERRLVIDSDKLSFIRITKTALLYRLQQHGVKVKYRDQICNGVKSIIQDCLEDFILQAEEQIRIAEGQETLRKHLDEVPSR